MITSDSGNNTVSHRQIPFTQIPNELINDPNISGNAKFIYMYIRSKPDNWKFSINGMKSQMKEGTRIIRQSLVELEQAGWLERLVIKDKGKFAGAKYITNFEPLIKKDPEIFDQVKEKLKKPSSQTDTSQVGTSQPDTHSNTIGSNKEKSNKEESNDFDKKKSKSGLNQKLINSFFDFHLKEKKFRYQFSGGKDGVAIKQIISKLKNLFKDKHLKEPRDSEILEAFEWLLYTVKKMDDVWIYDNLSLAIINSKLNIIVNYGKNGTTKGRKYQSVEEYIKERGVESLGYTS